MNYKYTWILRSIIFLSILAFSFITISYILRPLSDSRTSAMGLHVSEPVDAVFIGSSVVHMSYAPMLAWEQEGIATYSFTWNALTAESIEYAIKEVYKSQSPQLLVIDLKPFQYRDDVGLNSEAEIRNFSDAIPYSMNRLNYLLDVVPNNVNEEGDKDIFNYIFDIAKYHSLWATTGADSLRSWNNSVRSIDKGFSYSTNIGETNGFIDNTNITTQTAPSDYIQGVFNELLAYCKTLDCNVLFVVTTYTEPVEHRECYNYYANVIDEAGYDYINMNDHQKEVNLDFKTDFCDHGHLNLVGAFKYTEYFAKYLVETYKLPDHREDSAYAQWDKDYDEWYEKLIW